jgi:predicted SprT family Zn-dependent metalloprotease
MEDDYIAAAYIVPQNVIEISRSVMKEVPFEAIEDIIIPHELAHIARDTIYPHLAISKMDHSKRWKDIVKLLGVRKKYIDATYSMKDLKRYKR